MLEHLGAARAAAILVAISDPRLIRSVAAAARMINPDIGIVARARFASEVAALERVADAVVSEEAEGAREAVRRTLALFGK